MVAAVEIKLANLASRKDNLRNMEECFTYDPLNRLTYIIEDCDTTGVFAYDDYGRMTMKRIHGAMVFDNTLYGAEGRPHALERARMYAEMPEQNLKYTSFDKISSITQDDIMVPTYRQLGFDYGYEHQRLCMTETSVQDTIVKDYVGNCEFVRQNRIPVSERTYLNGPLGVFAVLDSHILPIGKGMYYVHPDHLGSWTTVTDRIGVVVQDVRFDPWGTPYYSDSTTLTPASSLLFDRGFTGHEHIMNFGLINMNGRVYDPMTSTFLSVDNYVQDPTYTQNFNRYAYCMNNPLKYTDPDGECFELLLGAVIGGIVNLAMNLNHINTISEGLTYFGIGAAAGITGAGVSLLGAGAGLVGLSGGSVSGGLTAAYNKTNIIHGIGVGALSGWIGGGLGQFVGGGGGAFLGGFVSNTVAQLPSIVKGEEYSIKQALFSGFLSCGMYYGASYYNWQFRGGKQMGDVSVSFQQFCRMQTLFQRSRAWNKEMGGYLMEDGSFKKVPNGTNSQITFETTPPEGAIAEFHTHWDKPGKTICYDQNGNYVTDPNQGRFVSTASRYHGATDYTPDIKSLVLNRYDGSYFSGEYTIQNLPNDFIGPPQFPVPFQIINPPVLRYNYGYLFSIRY